METNYFEEMQKRAQALFQILKDSTRTKQFLVENTPEFLHAHIDSYIQNLSLLPCKSKVFNEIEITGDFMKYCKISKEAF